jgi:tRNA pseudouridine55 synthase
MTRSERETPGPSGFLVVDKPPGDSSHDVVNAARRWLGTRRVGHLGTLDPLATGVLPLAVREATKLIAFLEPGPKVYRGTIRLGVETDTLDAEGQVLSEHRGELPAREDVLAALAGFQGDLLQVPPMFSSVKRGGVPLYRFARRGEVVERAPRKVRIESVTLLDYRPPAVEVEVVCSPGTYVRVLAADLGRLLGCGAHLGDLRRTRSGPFRLEQAVSPGALEGRPREEVERFLIAPEAALGLPVVALGAEDSKRVAHGAPIAAPGSARTAAGARFTGLSREAGLLAVLECRADRRLHPLRLLHLLVASD